MSSIIQAVIDSVLPTKPQPVVPNERLLQAMDLSFSGLLLTLVGLLFLTQGNLHVLALMFVAVGLWASVRWFVAELARMNHLNKPLELKIPNDPAQDQQAEELEKPKLKAS